MSDGDRLHEFKADLIKAIQHSFAGRLSGLQIMEKLMGVSQQYPELPQDGGQEAVSFIQGYRQAMLDMMTEDRWELDGKQYIKTPERDRDFKGRWSQAKYIGLWYKGEDACYSPMV